MGFIVGERQRQHAPGFGHLPRSGQGVAEVAGTPALLGRFPRHPLAVTALFAQVDNTMVTWQTWHVYPQSGEIVETRSELNCAP